MTRKGEGDRERERPIEREGKRECGGGVPIPRVLSSFPAVFTFYAGLHATISEHDLSSSKTFARLLCLLARCPPLHTKRSRLTIMQTYFLPAMYMALSSPSSPLRPPYGSASFPFLLIFLYLLLPLPPSLSLHLSLSLRQSISYLHACTCVYINVECAQVRLCAVCVCARVCVRVCYMCVCVSV